jgi:ribonucleoside-diphosphate reductase alpha chain
VRSYSATEISDCVWNEKYRTRSRDGRALEISLAETRARIATAVSVAESNRDAWAGRFEDAFSNIQLIPAGRINAGAGSDEDVSLVNTLVAGPIPDDPVAIYLWFKESYNCATTRQGPPEPCSQGTTPMNNCAPLHGI